MAMTKEESVVFIRGAIAEAGELSGAQLGSRLRERDVSWSPSAFGCASTRKFIDANIPDVELAGRTGMDVVYRLAALQRSTKSDSTNELWRAWVSPASPFDLAVHEVTGQVATWRKNSVSLGSSYHVLAGSAVEDHQKIGRDFITELGRTDLQSALESALNESGGAWWKPWARILEKNGLAKEWLRFRTSRLKLLLNERVRNLNLDSEVVRVAIGYIEATAAKKFEEKVAEKSGIESSSIRKVLRIAIDCMTDEELRSLSLPAGAWIKAIAELQKR